MVISAGLFFFLVQAQATPELPIKFTSFDISRERVEHKVIARATLVNTSSEELKDLSVHITYFDRDRELRSSTPCRLQSVPSKRSGVAVLEAIQVERFSRYELSLEAGDRRLVFGGNEEDALPVFRRDHRREKAGAAPGAAGGLTVELKGVKWIARDPLAVKNGPPGDIALLRIAVRRRGQETSATGALSVCFTEGNAPKAYATRRIQEESWRRDADELNSSTAVAESIAYDVLRGELWVAILCADSSKGAPRIDVTLDLEEGGTWIWNKLEKPFEVAPRVADRPPSTGSPSPPK